MAFALASTKTFTFCLCLVSSHLLLSPTSSYAQVQAPPPDESEVVPEPSLPLQGEGSLDSSLPLQRPPETSQPFDLPYVLGPGDKIDIAVYGIEEAIGVQEVLPDGSVFLPLIGSVMVSGQTLSSLTNELTQKFDVWLVSPTVSLSIRERRPITVSVTGLVQRPGPTQLTTNSASLLEAINKAGGTTRGADIRGILISRALPGGGQTSIEVDLWDSVWSQDQEQPVVSNALQILLRDGDAIYVPQMAADSDLDQRLMARSSLAPPTVRVRVVGEVRRPGEVQIPPDGTLSSAIASAGGPTRDGALQRVEYIRLNEAGEIERQQIDLANLTDDILVQDGDVLFVPPTNLASFSYTTSQLLSPFFGILNIFGTANNLLN